MCVVGGRSEASTGELEREQKEVAYSRPGREEVRIQKNVVVALTMRETQKGKPELIPRTTPFLKIFYLPGEESRPPGRKSGERGGAGMGACRIKESQANSRRKRVR